MKVTDKIYIWLSESANPLPEISPFFHPETFCFPLTIISWKDDAGKLFIP